MKTEPNILLKHALASAVSYINKDGLKPQEALEKTAEEYDLKPGFCELLSNGLNVALSYNHFKNTKTAEDKAKDFPISDASEVNKKRFGVKEKTEHEKKSEWFGKEMEHVDFNKILKNSNYKEAYVKMHKTSDRLEKNAVSAEGIIKQASDYINKLASDASNLQTETLEHFDKLNKTFAKLADSFSKEASARTSFEEFESQVYSKHGDASIPMLELIYKASEIKEERGVHDKNYMMFKLSQEAAMFDKLMEHANTFNEKNAAHKEAVENLAFEKDYIKEAYKLAEEAKMYDKPKTESTHVPEEKKAPAYEESDPILDRVKAKQKEEPSEKTEKEKEEKDSKGGHPEGESKEEHDKHEKSETPAEEKAEHKEHEEHEKSETAKEEKEEHAVKTAAFDFLSSLMGKFKEEADKPVSHNPLKTDPKMDSIMRSGVLQELIATDPILSKADPRKVAAAYEQIMHLAPNLSKEKEVVRALLRQMISSQSLGVFEASQLTEADINRMKHKLTASGHSEKK